MDSLNSLDVFSAVQHGFLSRRFTVTKLTLAIIQWTLNFLYVRQKKKIIWWTLHWRASRVHRGFLPEMSGLYSPHYSKRLRISDCNQYRRAVFDLCFFFRYKIIDGLYGIQFGELTFWAAVQVRPPKRYQLRKLVAVIRFRSLSHFA